jgi:hypothetical protein
MWNTVDVNSHGKRHTDFDLTRIINAQAQGFDEPIYTRQKPFYKCLPPIITPSS